MQKHYLLLIQMREDDEECCHYGVPEYGVGTLDTGRKLRMDSIRLGPLGRGRPPES